MMILNCLHRSTGHNEYIGISLVIYVFVISICIINLRVHANNIEVLSINNNNDIRNLYRLKYNILQLYYIIYNIKLIY